MNSSALTEGQKIELNDGRQATVRFVGHTSFQTGEWVGVELEEATGKNDGSVKGERYFECEPGHGMFLRPAGVRAVLQDVRKPAPTARDRTIGVKGRPSSIQSGVNGLKRQSLAPESGRRGSGTPASSSPTPSSRSGASGIRGSVKSPTKPPGSNGVSSTSTSRTSTPPAGKATTAGATSARPRHSMLPPSTGAGRRTSVMPPPPTGAASRASKPSRAPISVLSRDATSTNTRGAFSDRPSAGSRPGSHRSPVSRTTGDTPSENDSDQRESSSPVEDESSNQASQTESIAEEEDRDDTVKPVFAPPPVPPDPPSPVTRSRRPSSPASASIHSQRTIRSTAVTNRQIEELEAKVRLLERKRQEDREAKKHFEQAQQERDQYKSIIEKLQNKYRPQQQEIVELKQALAESEKRFVDVETSHVDHDAILEMATLDREMAEETAEGLKAELEAIRAHNEEVELELEILREEVAELTKEMSPSERESAGFVQLQHSNDRLRNALLALRDRSMDEKEELNEKVAVLEEQIKSVDALKQQHEVTRENLLRSEADISDLRQQLEVALQAEDMIEGLTERNGRLETTVDDLRVAVDDLENLKELNDELEINHVEAEKQMQEEIDFKDSLLIDRERTVKLQQEALDDRDYTITQFRALVSILQGDVADMRASREISETEAKDLEDKSRAMIDLNLRLQNSAAKTQVKTIDLELRRLEAAEASEHLHIVQLFLPETFQAERDSVLALLRFRRIGFKARLVQGFVKERVTSAATSRQGQDAFAACNILDKLAWITGMAERFVNSISGCNPEDFSNYAAALHELEPVERALNGYIDGLRKEEINERNIADELQRSIAVMSHLASLHIKPDLMSHADHLIMRTQYMQSQLESAATALQLCRSMIETHISQQSDEEMDDGEGSASDRAIMLTRAETLISHIRSAKFAVGKTHRSISELRERSLTLEGSITEAFGTTETMTGDVATYTRYVGEALQSLFAEEGRSEPFSSGEVSAILSRVAVSSLSLSAPEAGPLTALKDRLRDLTDQLNELVSYSTDLDNTVEFERGPAPWIARANRLQESKIAARDIEAELARTLEQLRSKDVAIAEKETELEEQSVRVEMLEARMKDASKRSARIAELEKALHEARDAEKHARRDLGRAKEEQSQELQRVRDEMDRLREEKRKRGTADNDLDDGAMGAAARLTMKKQTHKIAGLEGAVRYLSDENLRLRLPPADSPLSSHATLSWLHEPLFPAPKKTERFKQIAHKRKQGQDVLQSLLALSTSKARQQQIVDLTSLPPNKLAWRPAKDGSRWKLESRREEWEEWKDWRAKVVKTDGVAGMHGIDSERLVVDAPA